MIAVDTNILIYAHREELAEHVSALAWLTRLAEDPLLWGLPVFCLGEFVRVVTHPRIFDPPTRLESALEALFGLLASPSLRVLNPGPRIPSSFPNIYGRPTRAAT
ncbi:MAG: PIN domain-containing protein [Gammaproteobacteria bacterium]